MIHSLQKRENGKNSLFAIKGLSLCALFAGKDEQKKKYRNIVFAGNIR
jgi:hypothetical protein